MGYILHAFIGRQTELQTITNSFRNARLVNAGREIFIIPMTGELYDEINDLVISKDIGTLTYMSRNVEDKILGIIGNNCIAYIEAEYFGGQGGQTAILWQNGGRYKLFDFGEGAISSVLKHFGIIPEIGLDEFDTINLGRYRNTEDWLSTTLEQGL